MSPRERAALEAERVVKKLAPRLDPLALRFAVDALTDELEDLMVDGAQTLEALETLMEASP